MDIHILGENNSLFNQFIAEIRDKKIQQDQLRFRRNLERLGEIFAYEISKTLRYKTTMVETPLGTASLSLPAGIPVLATILRAGLPLHMGLLNYFDNAENCFILAYRKYEKDGFHIKFENISSPNLDQKVVILSDPMLATGASMEIGYNALHKRGEPAHVHMVGLIASSEGVDFVKEKLGDKNTTLWIGAIDEELSSKKYIVPGLGDAGDLAFGVKFDP